MLSKGIVRPRSASSVSNTCDRWLAPDPVPGRLSDSDNDWQRVGQKQLAFLHGRIGRFILDGLSAASLQNMDRGFQIAQESQESKHKCGVCRGARYDALVPCISHVATRVRKLLAACPWPASGSFTSSRVEWQGPT